MASSSGHHGTSAAIARYLKVLAPASCSNSLRIPDELAQHVVRGGAGAVGTALVVSPFAKVWRVEVSRDSEGRASLGRGWPEFVAAHGLGAWWFVVFRLEAGGMLTVKAFDTTCCLREISRPISAANHRRGGGVSRRPQFIKLLLGVFVEKLLIPPEFVRKYIAELEMRSSSATVILSPLCKICAVAVEKDGSDGNLFFSRGWSQFLLSHGVTEYDVLLVRYEGNMVFTVKVFGPNGCQKVFKDDKEAANNLKQLDREFAGTETTEKEDRPSSSRKCKNIAKKPADGEQISSKKPRRCQKVFKDQEANGKQLDRADTMTSADSIKTEEEDPPSSSRKRNSMAKKSADGEESSKRPRRCTTASNKSLSSLDSSVYQIGPPSWMKREISTYILSNCLMVAGTFCKAIGLLGTSEITLMATVHKGRGTRSWQVRLLVYGNRSRGYLARGWRKFCVDNGIKEGDICTFNIVKATMWRVDIMRRG